MSPKNNTELSRRRFVANIIALREEWMTKAACRGLDPNLFHPERGENIDSQTAKSVCGNCDVQNKCRDFALENSEKLGIWGGLTEKERRKLQKERNE